MSRVKMMCVLAAMLALSVVSLAQSPKVIAEKLCAQFDQAWANHDLNQLLGFFD